MELRGHIRSKYNLGNKKVRTEDHGGGNCGRPSANRILSPLPEGHQAYVPFFILYAKKRCETLVLNQEMPNGV